jgi:transposase InsO family protein
MAFSRRTPQPGLVQHSERGSQYASNGYTGLLIAHGIDISRSLKANPWDSRTCESFIKTLKYEEVLRNESRHKTEALTSRPVFEEGLYNKRRLHWALGYAPTAEIQASLSAHSDKNAIARRPSV